MKQFIFILSLIALGINLTAQERILISEIIFTGNNITKDYVLNRELEFEQFETYKIEEFEKKIKSSKENLLNLKIFNFVEISKKIITNDDLIKNASITVKVTERWYVWPFPILEISERNFNSWWQDFEGSNYSDFSRLNYGVFLNWENFRGRNELIKAKFRRGFKEHYLFYYQIPFLNKEKTIGLNICSQIFRKKKDYYETDNNVLLYHHDENYATKNLELYSEIVYRKKINQTHKLKMSYFKVEVSDSIIIKNPNYLGVNLNAGSFYKITYEYIFENRDYIIYPLDGFYINFEVNKFFQNNIPVNHYEFSGHLEQHIPITNNIFLGSSIRGKACSNEYQPYHIEEGFGFDDYVRGYEYYVINGQNNLLSKTAIKYALTKKKTFELPYIKMDQFKKSYFALYLGVFSDLGYVDDNQNSDKNPLGNTLLWGNGISLDYVTYYDKLIRIEFSINHLGEKGLFLHFSNPFGNKKKL